MIMIIVCRGEPSLIMIIIIIMIIVIKTMIIMIIIMIIMIIIIMIMMIVCRGGPCQINNSCDHAWPDPSLVTADTIRIKIKMMMFKMMLFMMIKMMLFMMMMYQAYF